MSDATDAVVTPEWVGNQEWLRPHKENDEWFRRFAFGKLELWMHAKCDNIDEWVTLYIGRESVASNPTEKQVVAFKKAFETLKP